MKLRYYLLPTVVLVITTTDLVKYKLSRPMLRGRIGKWILALAEFHLEYVFKKAVKGQVLANFLADHPSQTESHEIMVLGTASVEPWKMWFDGSKANGLTGIGIVTRSP